MPGRKFNGGDYRYGYQGSEKDDEIAGVGNSYTTHFRMLDPRIGRWKSVDPVFQPWQSPYTSMDNNPILYNDPNGDCIGCPDKDNFEGREFTHENGSTYIFSNEVWTPNALYNDFLNDPEHATSYFDYYAGKKGFDLTRADWGMQDMLGADIKKYEIMLFFQNAYNNDAADNLMEHYAYGNGDDYNISLSEYKSGIGLRKTYGVLSFKEGKAAIDKLNNGASEANVTGSKLAYSAHAGTIGNHYITISGKVTKTNYGSWVFKGKLQVLDIYDFDPRQRGAVDEASVTYARRNLWGSPFRAIGTFPIMQHGLQSPFDIYRGMNRENIISNPAKLDKFLESLKFWK